MCAMLREAGFGSAEVLETWEHPLNRWGGPEEGAWGGVGGGGALSPASRRAAPEEAPSSPSLCLQILHGAAIGRPAGAGLTAISRRRASGGRTRCGAPTPTKTSCLPYPLMPCIATQQPPRALPIPSLRTASHSFDRLAPSLPAVALRRLRLSTVHAACLPCLKLLGFHLRLVKSLTSSESSCQAASRGPGTPNPKPLGGAQLASGRKCASLDHQRCRQRWAQRAAQVAASSVPADRSPPLAAAAAVPPTDRQPFLLLQCACATTQHNSSSMGASEQPASAAPAASAAHSEEEQRRTREWLERVEGRRGQPGVNYWRMVGAQGARGRAAARHHAQPAAQQRGVTASHPIASTTSVTPALLPCCCARTLFCHTA